MTTVKMIVALLAFVLALATAAPGGWGGKSEHVVIHVPYHVHTVHHHHVKKVHVPYPVVKKIVVHEPVIHEKIIHEPIIEHGGWW
ncbi:uncharacterized protein [Leptinotarsa decemlineata]|uniref:uncharacterized protein n=1 Tax=Leptinotarsa decemlineata TaxID=7539 RepID=UPI003D30B24D